MLCGLTKYRKYRLNSSGFSRLAFDIHTCFISNTFINNDRLKLAKNKAKAKQHPQAELLLFENYSLSSSRVSSKSNSRYSKKCTKSKYVCLIEVI